LSGCNRKPGSHAPRRSAARLGNLSRAHRIETPSPIIADSQAGPRMSPRSLGDASAALVAFPADIPATLAHASRDVSSRAQDDRSASNRLDNFCAELVPAPLSLEMSPEKARALRFLTMPQRKTSLSSHQRQRRGQGRENSGAGLRPLARCLSRRQTSREQPAR